MGNYHNAKTPNLPAALAHNGKLSKLACTKLAVIKFGPSAKVLVKKLAHLQVKQKIKNHPLYNRWFW
ncbi:hypothetical protein B0189_09300 [Moraxella cuniculi]|nr:hypothetical protein B0189_09300 [Moraxella cuniculi]